MSTAALMMSHSQVFAADTDVLGFTSPYANHCPFPLYSEEDSHSRSSHPFALPPPQVSLPSTSPSRQPTAPQPRRRSTTLFLLSPTFTHEPPLYQQWGDIAPAGFSDVGTAEQDDVSRGSVSPMPSAHTPSISVTYASSIASTTSPSITPIPLTPIPSPAPTPSPRPYSTAATSFKAAPATIPAARTSLRASARPRAVSDGASGIPSDRVLRKRRRQRECDIHRRLVENSGFSRLSALLAAQSAKKQQKLIQQRKEDEDQAEEEDDEDAARKLNKADILHQSADRIEQLQRMIADLKESQSRRGSIQSSMFTHSAACIMVIHVPSGFVADASQRYLEHSMTERSWLVGRRCFPPYEHLVSHPNYLLRPSSTGAHQRDRVLCKPAGGELQETVPRGQSEASLRAMHQLLSGELDTIYTVWRNQLGDGRVWERSAHSWVAEWDEHADGTRTPLYVIGLISRSETVCVD